MSRRISTLLFLLVCAMFVPGFAMAQNQGGGGGGGGGRGKFDPAQFRQRRMEQIKEQLGVNDDEWKVLEPKISKVEDARREAMAGFMMGFGGRRGGGGGGGGFGGGGGGGGDQPQSEVGRASQDLR